MDDWLSRFLAAEGLPLAYAQVVERVCTPLAETIVARRAGPGFVVGICGAQGSGKSTLSAVLAHQLEARGLKVATLSIDDLYLTRAERQALAREVHPLLATRGVPGTHDVDLGVQVLAALAQPGRTVLPRFDKAADDRAARETWPGVEGPVDVILFEGWCVGARPQAEADLAVPVNALEQEEDAGGAWRAFVNAALAGPYRRLFAPIGFQVLLRAPGFEVVLAWRREQEAKLRARLAAEGQDQGRAMDDAGVARFIAHYERLTRWILADMPARADLVLPMDEGRKIIA
ncbi:MAG TPA: kinase [Phenylobacterium sp.]|nr:kinase [Phenylobacterium sp.]